MAQRYEPKVIEPKWQAVWAENKIYEVTSDDTSKEKVYATPMLPYPSGTGLHTGHVRNYSITDAVARYYRQKGFNTLSTIAWDAFGLPAENFAIKTGTPPAVSTAQNIAYFKSQLQRLGMSYDWSREFDTSSPEYYRWTQWVFGLMYKKGLAYKAEKQQWWCDKCNTVLADEQVNADGKCWRHEGPDDALVTKKSVNQWFFKITEYADEILQSTDALDWPEKIKTMQKNWIGKSEGALVRFDLTDGERIEVYTTRVDTLFGTTFIVLAPEHPMVNRLIDQCDNPQDVEKYVEKARRKSELQREMEKVKTGVALEGIRVKNPINGKDLPVWIADYVLTSYGTGAVMGVPAHDARDNEFATKYGLEIIPVVEPVLVQTTGTAAFRENEPVQDSDGVIAIVKHWSDDTYMGLKWPGPGWGTLLTGGIDEGMTAEETVLKEIREETGFTDAKIVRSLGTIHSKYYHEPKGKNRFGHAPTFYVELQSDKREKVADEETAKHELVWLKKNELHSFLTATSHQQAVELLDNPCFGGYGRLVNSGEYTGTDSYEAKIRIVEALAKKDYAEAKTQYKIRDWLVSRQRYWGAPVPIVYCEEHGEVLVPEDQLPVQLPEVANYVPDGKNSSVLAGVDEWVNTTCPTCKGPAKRETDILDGYVCSTWYLHRYTDAHNSEKAFDTEKANYWFPIDFYFGGDHAVAHLLYIRFFQKVLCDAGLASEREPIKKLVYNGYINAEDGRKMSKSLGNTVDPMDIINSGYGADALRVFELFIAPYDQDTSWNSNGVPGTYRFLNRIWTLTQEFLENTEAGTGGSEEVLRSIHRAIKKVSEDMQSLSFNTAVAAMMTAVNELYAHKAQYGYGARDAWRFALESLVQIVAPFAPHISEELWSQLGHEDTVHISHWPTWDEKYLLSSMVTYAVQINGKVRAEIEVPSEADEAEVVAQARAHEKVASYISGDPKKTIFVQGKLVSFVV
jgi:leucyl-tRNA synthetase